MAAAAANDWEPPTQNRELVRRPERRAGGHVRCSCRCRRSTLPPAPEIPASSGRVAAAPIQLVAYKAPPSLVELEGELLQVVEREQAASSSALQIASGFAQRVALFIVQRGLMQGVRCLERGEPRPIEGVLVPLHTDSMLTVAATATEGLRLDPRERALDARLLQLLGDEGATEVGLYPVAVKQRVVNVIYASNGAAPLGAIGFAALSPRSRSRWAWRTDG